MVVKMGILKKLAYKFLNYNFIFQLILLIVFLCISLGIFFAIIKQYYNDDNNYLKIAVSGIFTISTTCLTIIRSQEDKTRSVALQYVTDKRIVWLKDTRSLTTSLCKSVTYYLYDNNDNKEKTREAYSQIMEAISGLYIRYNFSGERDQILLHLLDAVQHELEKIKLIYNSDSNEYCIRKEIQKEKIRKILELLMLHTQVYLKLEWERVKEETIYEGDISLRKYFVKERMVKERLRLYKDRLKYQESNANIKDILKEFSLETIYEGLKNKK